MPTRASLFLSICVWHSLGLQAANGAYVVPNMSGNDYRETADATNGQETYAEVGDGVTVNEATYAEAGGATNRIGADYLAPSVDGDHDNFYGTLAGLALASGSSEYECVSNCWL